MVPEAPVGGENACLGVEGAMALMGMELRQGSPNHRGLKWIICRKAITETDCSLAVDWERGKKKGKGVRGQFT